MPKKSDVILMTLLFISIFRIQCFWYQIFFYSAIISVKRKLISSLDRSLPTLEVLGESSLMSILRWNFKTNMEKTMFSSDNGQIMLVGFILIYEMDQLFIFTILCVIINDLIYSHTNFFFFLQIQLGKRVHFVIFFFLFCLFK